MYEKIYLLEIHSSSTASCKLKCLRAGKIKIYDAGVAATLIPAKDIPRNERFITAPVEFENLKNLAKTDKEVTIDYKYKFALPVNVNIDVLRTVHQENFSETDKH